MMRTTTKSLTCCPPLTDIFLCLAAAPQQTTAELITYGFSFDITNAGGNFADETLPASATGMLTFESTSAPTATVRGFAGWIGNPPAPPLGALSAITVDLGGGVTLSTDPGRLDANAFDGSVLFGLGPGSYALTFGTDHGQGLGSTSNAPIIKDDGNTQTQYSGTTLLSFLTLTDGPANIGSLDFDLMTQSNWNGFGFPFFPEFHWAIPGAAPGGGDLIGENVLITSVTVGQDNVVPEPASVAMWMLLGLTLAGYGWISRSRQESNKSSVG